MDREDALRRRKPDGSRTQQRKRATAASSRSSRCFCRPNPAGKLALIGIFAVFACIVYFYATSPTSAVVIEDVHDKNELKWTHAANRDLERGRKVLSDLKGPESIVVDDVGNWYTGLHDGRLLKITGGDNSSPKVIDITAFANYTAGKQRSRRRPLGLRLAGRSLYLADAYQGIFEIDVHSFKWKTIVGYDGVSPPLLFPDDLAVSKDGGTVYFTDISLKWMYHEIPYSVIEGECSGRVIKVDLISKKLQTLREGLCFPNGIELNREETRIAVSETTRRRITVLDIRSGETVESVFLPGGADNIRQAKTGGYWVPIPAFHNPLLDVVNNYPFVRDVTSSILGLKGLYRLVNINQGTVIKLDEEFRPVRVYYDPDGKVCQAVTEVQEYKKGKFLMGSFQAPGIVVIDGIEN